MLQAAAVVYLAGVVEAALLHHPTRGGIVDEEVAFQRVVENDEPFGNGLLCDVGRNVCHGHLVSDQCDAEISRDEDFEGFGTVANNLLNITCLSCEGFSILHTDGVVVER